MNLTVKVTDFVFHFCKYIEKKINKISLEEEMALKEMKINFFRELPDATIKQML